MKKYYELHEEFWQGLVKQGHISWDRESEQELMSRERNKTLSKYLDNFPVGSALDLGCGSGSQSFYLASLGFECTGIDISKTAIEEGIKLSKKLGYEIDLLCDDVCHFELNKKFDLITDSCILHCLVWEEDRSNFFERIKYHLSENGKVFIYTMIVGNGSDQWGEIDHLHFDKDNILWSTGPDSFDVKWTSINDKKYFPHRRVYSAEKQRQEILNNGFKIISEEILSDDEHEIQTYVAWIE